MQYTTIEQSRRLVELGLGPETADLYLQRTIYPAWSLDALLKVIPCPYQMTRECDGTVQFMLLYVMRRDTYDTELEAVYTMVVWLLENDLLDEQKLRNYEQEQ